MKANSRDNAPKPRLVNIPQPLKGAARGVPLVEYDAPSLSSQLHDLCLGPHGNLWYADYSAGNKIGRFNPDTAEFTEWDMPTENSYPHSVITDEAGNLWITEALGNKIAVFKVSLRGAVGDEAISFPGTDCFASLAMTCPASFQIPFSISHHGVSLT